MNLFVRIHRTRRNLHWWKSTFLGIFKYLFGSKQALALSLRMRGLGSFATAIMGPLSSSGPPPAFPSFFASSLCFPRLVRESTCSANLFPNSPELIFRWFGTAAKCFYGVVVLPSESGVLPAKFLNAKQKRFARSTLGCLLVEGKPSGQAKPRQHMCAQPQGKKNTFFLWLIGLCLDSLMNLLNSFLL